MEQKVVDFIAAEGLFKPGEKVLLAVSGGADSTALLYITASLRAGGVMPLEISCAHVNHQLRGDEAQRDEEFVVSRCNKLNLPVITRRIGVRGYAHTKKVSIETAARKLRIDALLDIATQQNCTCIATAHQKNDNAETILYRMIRGTGFRGLCGIWPAKQFGSGIRFVRPLLCASRDKIIQYLNSRSLKWCADKTNEDLVYKRNFIRHQLLPTLQKDCSKVLVEELSELAKASRSFYQMICEKADEVWPDVAVAKGREVILNSEVLTRQHPEVQIEIVRRVLSQLDAGEQEITQWHYKNILCLSSSEKLQLPKGVEVFRQGGKIIFNRPRKKTDSRTVQVSPKQLNIPGKTEFAGVLIEAEVLDYERADFEKFKATKSDYVEWFDFGNLKLPLEIRLWEKGDCFWPLGMRAEKKVGKFLTDAKVSPVLRKNLFVVADSEKIIWLYPIRISEQAKVANQTNKVLQLKGCS